MSIKQKRNSTRQKGFSFLFWCVPLHRLLQWCGFSSTWPRLCGQLFWSWASQTGRDLVPGFFLQHRQLRRGNLIVFRFCQGQAPALGMSCVGHSRDQTSAEYATPLVADFCSTWKLAAPLALGLFFPSGTLTGTTIKLSECAVYNLHPLFLFLQLHLRELLPPLSLC